MYQEIGKKLKSKHKAKLQKDFQVKGKAEEDEPAIKHELPDFSKAIKRLRQESGLSLEKLSEQTGINKQTLHSIENYSIKNPSFTNIEKIAAAFDLSLNDFILQARVEFKGNLFKTSAAERWDLSFETEKGFSIHAYSPPRGSKRDFFVGVMTIKAGKKLRHWKFTSNAKACIQPWDGDVLFIYHGMNWRKEEHVLASETLYFDASIAHSFENLSERNNRVLIVTYPSIF